MAGPVFGVRTSIPVVWSSHTTLEVSIRSVYKYNNTDADGNFKSTYVTVDVVGSQVLNSADDHYS